MPNIGFWATAGAGGAAAGAMELIATQTVGVTGSVTFSSIPQDFKHIRLIWNANENATTDAYDVSMAVNLNGDYGQAYFTNSQAFGQGSLQAITGTYNSNGNYAYLERVLRAANVNVLGPTWSYGEIWIPNYASTAFSRRTIAARGGQRARSSQRAWVASLGYNNGAAVNSITLRPRHPDSYNSWLNFQSGSSFTLYGYRG